MRTHPPMHILVLQSAYDACRQICLTLADDILRLASKAKSKNFFTKGLLLLRREIIGVAAHLAECARPQDADTYTIKAAHYTDLLERVSGIAGIAILYLEALRWESLQRICGKLLDLLARLHNAELTAT